MSHNPIVKMVRLGFFDSIEIPMNSMGVLYSHNQHLQDLKPGERVSFSARLGGSLVLYMIDRTPHLMSWRVNLLSKDVQDSFPVTVNLKYRVADGRRMVEDQVNDTEALVARALETKLRKRTREFMLNQHKQVEVVLEDELSHEFFSGLGLELMEKDVLMSLSNADLERVGKLDEIERVQKVAQQVEHQDNLPTKEAGYYYQAHVIVNYRVVDFKLLPTTDLREAEQWLWGRIKTRLRRKSGQFTLEQVREAEEALQDEVGEEHFQDHGILINQVQIQLDLDESTRAHAEQKRKMKEEAELAELKAQAEDLQRQRELKAKVAAIDFYAPIIREENYKLLAASLAENQMDAMEVLKYLDEKQRLKLEAEARQQSEKWEKQQWLLEKLLEKDWIAPEKGFGLGDDVIDGMRTDVRIESLSQLGEGKKAALPPSDATVDLPPDEDAAPSAEEKLEPEPEDG